MALYVHSPETADEDSQSWKYIEFSSAGDVALAMQWNGGATYPIHGKSIRRLPDLSFAGLYRNSGDGAAKMNIKLLAEGYTRADAPITVTFLPKGETAEDYEKVHDAPEPWL